MISSSIDSNPNYPEGNNFNDYIVPIIVIATIIGAFIYFIF